MSAQKREGAGTYLMSWGDSLFAAVDSIELEVPGSTTKYAVKYSTTFTWLLTDTPDKSIATSPFKCKVLIRKGGT